MLGTFEEHKILKKLICFINDTDLKPKPVLLIRPYIKDTSPEMDRLREKSNGNVKFVDMLWDIESITPLKDDLTFCNLLKHCSLGINAASTVSLDLMVFKKGVINISFDPPESNLPLHLKWERHIKFDHYEPIAKSGAVLVSHSIDDLFDKILNLLDDPHMLLKSQSELLDGFFGDKLDGMSSNRLADALISCTIN